MNTDRSLIADICTYASERGKNTRDETDVSLLLRVEGKHFSSMRPSSRPPHSNTSKVSTGLDIALNEQTSPPYIYVFLSVYVYRCPHTYMRTSSPAVLTRTLHSCLKKVKRRRCEYQPERHPLSPPFSSPSNPRCASSGVSSLSDNLQSDVVKAVIHHHTWMRMHTYLCMSLCKSAFSSNPSRYHSGENIHISHVESLVALKEGPCASLSIHEWRNRPCLFSKALAYERAFRGSFRVLKFTLFSYRMTCLTWEKINRYRISSGFASQASLTCPLSHSLPSLVSYLPKAMTALRT